MKRLTVILLVLLAGLQQANATHYRAGVMSYQLLSSVNDSPVFNTYVVTVTTYTTNIYVPPDRDTVTVDWGDGTESLAPRINGVGVPLGNNIKVNVYVTPPHTYPGFAPYFIISMGDPNRMDGILNIDQGNSSDVPFYIEDTLKMIDPAYSGYENSPLTLNPPIDFGNVGDTFRHNPNVYDPDGDSVTYQLVPSLQAQGSPAPNYIFPNQYGAGQPSINDKLTINPQTGELVWATPQYQGPYNVAILITTFRQGVELGTELYDMMIIVQQEQDYPPHINPLRDTCVVAGTDLQAIVTAADTEPGQIVSLSANGGPLSDSLGTATSTPIYPPATFSTYPVLYHSLSYDTAWGLFNWQTNCNDIRPEAYQIVFVAQDSSPNPLSPLIPLADQYTWLIKVVGPGPTNLQAKAVNNVVNLTWDSAYACGFQATSHFIGFSIWRREGPNPFTPDTCNPGLAGHGYTEIDDLDSNYTYADSSVEMGIDYCYRIQAEFADTTGLGYFYNQMPSLPSNESCANLKISLPVITKVSIGVTDAANGTDTVAWEKPNTTDFDTTQHAGPYQFVLYRWQGLPGSSVDSIKVDSVSSPYFASFTDTFYIDTGLNTTNYPYTYKVVFYSNGVKLGASVATSSVFLIARRNNKSINLLWQDSVPWLNQQFEIFKLNPATGNFDSIATVDTMGYNDLGLINDSLYCYRILTIGNFTVPGLQSPILNMSQEACQRPHDTIPPCAPVLTVTNPCTGLSTDSSCSVGPDQLKNTLTWTRPPDSCGHYVRGYYIYFAEPGTQTYLLVDSLLSATDTTIQYSNNNSLAGCFAVTAIDTAGNQSIQSNQVCVDNCPCYRLPNVFTPNGDSHNDYFTPIMPFRFVSSVEMKIFNRWGDLVFETTDPNINWDGNDMKTGKPLAEDTYYYVCQLYEIRENGIVPDAETLKGFIHLIRGNGGMDK